MVGVSVFFFSENTAIFAKIKLLLVVDVSLG